MKKLLLPLLLLPLALGSCITEDVPDNTAAGNLLSLWQTLDERYCFFPDKEKEYGLDWDSVYAKYSRRVSYVSSTEQLFEVCDSMLRNLRDGHVNLIAAHNTARYWEWFENYPANYSDSIERIYLGTDYRMTAGIKYRILPDHIGYMRVSTFENGLGSGNLSEIFRYFAPCEAVIVDVRSNSGGLLTSAAKLAGCFVNEKTRVGYMCHKTGPGHNDFSSREPLYVSPAEGIRWQKPVAVLTNRNTYSAANSFVMYMMFLPKVVTVGDRTGGGAGMPFSSELPNGWTVRFSACPMYDVEGNCTEGGIDPDVRVNIVSDDYDSGVDTIIERARQLLKTM